MRGQACNSWALSTFNQLFLSARSPLRPPPGPGIATSEIRTSQRAGYGSSSSSSSSSSQPAHERTRRPSLSCLRPLPCPRWPHLPCPLAAGEEGAFDARFIIDVGSDAAARGYPTSAPRGGRPGAARPPRPSQRSRATPTAPRTKAATGPRAGGKASVATHGPQMANGGTASVATHGLPLPQLACRPPRNSHGPPHIAPPCHAWPPTHLRSSLVSLPSDLSWPFLAPFLPFALRPTYGVQFACARLRSASSSLSQLACRPPATRMAPHALPIHTWPPRTGAPPW